MKLLRFFNTSRPRAALAALLVLFTLTACAMNDLPRNMNLKAFQPHRADFTCVHEAPKLPTVTVEAAKLFHQGMVATSYDLWPNQRDYKLAAQLWEQATTLGHWKAAMNLAGLYESGLGVPRDTERAVQIVEGLMKQGVPGAFDKMGTYHQSGIGVKPDIDRAYGFWQLAADMGSPGAQTYIGNKLDAAYDDAQMGIWGNRTVGLKMLECAFAQGYGEAAYRLGQTLDIDKDFARALAVLHEGVKFGGKVAANYLSSSFTQVDPLTGNQIDRARAERYSLLGDALELNPDLRFPNLDKVLPLPPAALPFWDGKRQTLIDAAKPVFLQPAVPATPGASRTGRAHIPQGHVLAGRVTLPPDEYAYDRDGRPWSLTSKHLAHFTGYWWPRITVIRGDWQRDWNAAQVPWHFKRGEELPSLAEHIPPGYGSVAWDYQGQAVPQAAAPVHPYVAQGVARYVPAPGAPRSCSATVPCPQTGIWEARLKKEHAHHAVFHDRWQQAYLAQGQPFPVPAALHEAGGLAVAARDIRWHWLGEPNLADVSGHVHVTLAVAQA